MGRVKLGEICDILNGYTFKSSLYQDSGIRIIRITNVQNGLIEDKEPKYYGLDKENEIQKYMLQENDLLISLTGNVGRVGLITKDLLPAALNQRVACLRLKNKCDIDIKYIYNALNNSIFERKCILNAKGIAQMNLSTEWLKEYEIDVPLKAIQNEISSKLDKIQEIIDISKTQIEELDKLIKSQFVEMFVKGKCYKKISGKELFSFSSGKFLEANKRLKHGIPVYGGNGIAWHTRESLINNDTIVIGRVGAYCGNVKLIKEPVWITDNAIYIKEFKKNVYNIDFLYYMMELVDFSQFAQFSGQPKITKKPLEEYLYVVPPMQEQILFSNIVKQIDKQKIEIQKRLEEMKKLQESLMNKYFG